MKKFFAALLVGCMMFAFTACTPAATPSTTPDVSTEPAVTSTETAAPQEVTVGVLIYKYDDTYISTVRTAIQKYADENTDVKITLDMQDAQGDQAKQNDQLDVLISKKVNALLVNMVDAASAQGVADKAKEAGIPTIFFNREPAAEVTKSVNGLFVGTTASEAGVMQGDILADLYEADKKIDLNGDGKLQYVVFKGEADNPEAIARSKFSVDQAVKRGLTMDAVVKDPIVANWTTAEAQSKMEATFSANKGIEVVFANNDDMALGVIAALNNAGYNKGAKGTEKWIPVIGVDATEAGMAAVNAGTMWGTVKQDGEAMGKALVAVIANAATGKASPYLDGTSYTLDADGVSIRIPYAPALK